MSKKKTGSHGLRKNDLERVVIDFFQENPAVTFSLKSICKQLHLRTSQAKMLLIDVLEGLLMDDFVKEQPRGYYTLNMPSQVMTGIFHRKANGKNTFEPADGGEPILVAERNSLHAMDGDTVLVWLDGDYTIKTYCEDETGHPWLVPQNEAYEPIRLEDYERVTIVGVVKRVTKCAPRANYRTCMRLINRAKEKQPEMRAVSPEQVARAVRRVAPMVQVGRQWYAVYRVLADCKVVKEEDFGTFCELVKGEVPEHDCLPTRVELQRMAVQSFAKPVAMWNEANAPVQGKRFKDYARIAERMQEIVEN